MGRISQGERDQQKKPNLNLKKDKEAETPSLVESLKRWRAVSIKFNGRLEGRRIRTRHVASSPLDEVV